MGESEASEMEALFFLRQIVLSRKGGRFEIETTKEASMRYTHVRQHDTTDQCLFCNGVPRHKGDHHHPVVDMMGKFN